jgi:HPt (histidine-containing phosphotransfer) domain-containing protein
VGGDERALAKLIRIFLDDSTRLMARIRGAVARGDAPELRAAAHALKGSVSNFAAPAATESALRLQKLAEKGQLAGARRGCAVLERELGNVRAALEKIRSGLTTASRSRGAAARPPRTAGAGAGAGTPRRRGRARRVSRGT